MSDDQSTPVPPGLTRYTVNLTTAAWSALEAAAHRTEDSRTDIVNIAVMLYAQLVEAGDRQGVIYLKAGDVAGKPLYLVTSRIPFERPTKRRSR